MNIEKKIQIKNRKEDYKCAKQDNRPKPPREILQPRFPTRWGYDRVKINIPVAKGRCVYRIMYSKQM
jgi:hypothetical protein